MLKNKTVRKGFLSKILLVSSFVIVLFASAAFAGPCDNWSGTNPVYYSDGSTCKRYACKSEGVIATTLGTADMSYCGGSSSSGGSGSGSSSCTSGQKENKYTASGCSYTTSTRTCCNDKTWSDWDKACSGSSNCSSSQCWNPSTKSCESKPSGSCTCSNGYCSRSYSCGSNGWTYTDGACTCKTGYEKNSSGKCVEKCVSGNRVIETVQRDCSTGDSVACATAVFNSAKMIAKTIAYNGACTATKTSGCYKQLHSNESWSTKTPPDGGYSTHASVACYSSTCVVSGDYVCPK